MLLLDKLLDSGIARGAAGCICSRAPGFGGVERKDNIFTELDLFVIVTKLELLM
jgi:hypothetical protein